MYEKVKGLIEEDFEQLKNLLESTVVYKKLSFVNTQNLLINFEYEDKF